MHKIGGKVSYECKNDVTNILLHFWLSAECILIILQNTTFKYWK